MLHTQVTSVADPCPFPSGEKRRRLNQKEKLLHAPMANLGELTYAFRASSERLPSDTAMAYAFHAPSGQSGVLSRVRARGLLCNPCLISHVGLLLSAVGLNAGGD